MKRATAAGIVVPKRPKHESGILYLYQQLQQPEARPTFATVANRLCAARDAAAGATSGADADWL